MQTNDTNKPATRYHSPLKVLFGIGIAIILCDIIVFFLFIAIPYLRARYNPLTESLMSIIILSPALYFSVFLPMTIEIRKRKEAEEQVRRERDTAQHYLDIAGVIIVVIKADQTVRLINKKGCEILECPETDIVGKKWFDTFVPERLRDEVKAVFKDLMEGRIKAAEYFENPVLTKSGKERFIAWHNGYVKDERGAIVATLSSGEDITERKLQDQQLMRRDYQLEILSRTSVHINAVLDIPVIMRTLVASATELVGATGGAAGLFMNGKMVFTEYNRDGKAFPVNYVFERGQGVPGWVIDNPRPYFTNDAERDPHVIPELRKEIGFYSLVDVPIISRTGGLLGCLEIHNKADHQPFDTQDVFMLQGLAASAAIALENARLLEKAS